MQVADATPGHTAERRKRPGVGIEQHLVALAGIGHQPERPRRTQLHVRDLHAVIDAAHHQALFALGELVHLAEPERQRDEGINRCPLALALAPRPR